MKALTLFQPWAWAVSCGLKRVENRPWAPPALMMDQVFAIHAGKKYDYESEAILLGLHPGGDPRLPEEVPRGAVTAVARLIAVAHDESEVVKFTKDRSQARWFFGPFGWILDDIRLLPEPIPCRGYQQLWKLHPNIEEKVLEQL